MSKLVNLRAKKIQSYTFDANCKLKRKEFGESLLGLVNSCAGPFTLALNDSYGSGKTTFLRMWQELLEGKGHKCVYVDAWETDYAEDPLLPILKELEAQGLKNQDEFRQAVSKVAAIFAKRGITALVKALMYDAIPGSNTVGALISPEIEKTIVDGGGNVSDDTLDALQQFDDEQNAIGKLKESLREIVDELVGKDKQLVILVDELDRCKPTYAVDLLERIKHIFDIPRVVFVLGLHQDQLQHAVRGVYSSGVSEFDAERYLRKFFDLELKLPEPQTEDYAEYLVERFDLEGFFEPTRHLTPS